MQSFPIQRGRKFELRLFLEAVKNMAQNLANTLL